MSVKDCVSFSKRVLCMLNEKGFHVESLPEALSCITSIADATTMIEVNIAMEELNGRPS